MNYFFSLIIGYTIGSFPTAYLILKRTRNLDITNEGTGNVGAMNSFEATNSKLIGGVVLIFDLLKGMLPIIILKIFSLSDFSLFATSLLACIFSHCYNPWLRLRGGRGLASAAGGIAIIFPLALGIWGILWISFYFMKKEITIANVVASVITLILILILAPTTINYTFPKADSEAVLVLFSIGLFLVIISKHTEPLQELFKSVKSSTKREIKNEIR